MTVLTGVAAGSKLFAYAPSQWRVIHYLRRERVRPGIPGSTQPRGLASTQSHDLARVMDRQSASFGDLQMLEHYGAIVAGVGLGVDAVRVVLADLPRAPRQSRNREVRLQIELTTAGQTLARDPLHLVLQAAGRRTCYQVKDVASSAGVGDADVKPILQVLEAADLAGLGNDQGYVPVDMWTYDIPRNLRVRLTRKGRTYLARRA